MRIREGCKADSPLGNPPQLRQTAIGVVLDNFEIHQTFANMAKRRQQMSGQCRLSINSSE